MQIHQPSVTGSLAVTGSIVVTGSTTVSGSLFNPTIAENNSSDLITVKVDTSSGAFFFSTGSSTSITGSDVIGPFGPNSIISASYAVSSSHEIIKEVSSSHADQADTASFVTGSSVHGPFGSNSILSASFALTASYLSGSSDSASYSLTSSYALTASHFEGIIESASYASQADTASFVTGSSVHGPFGSNSILSASFAISSAYSPPDDDWKIFGSYVTSSRSACVKGDIVGEESLIIGPGIVGNTGQYSSLIGAVHSNTGDYSLISGEINCNTQRSSFIHGANNCIFVGGQASIIGGKYNQISGSSPGAGVYGAILGGDYNLLGHNRSFIIGTNITSSADYTTFVDNFNISGSLTDSDGSIGTLGQVLSSDGVGKVQWTSSIASASFATTSLTASFALTASYFSGSIESSSYAITASHALTASYFSGSIESSSYAITASHALTASYAPPDTDWYQFPGTNHITASGQVDISGSSNISSSLTVTGSTDITGSLSITGPTITTGSLTTTQGDVNFHGCSATALSVNINNNVFREGANALNGTFAHTSFGGGINDTIKTTGRTNFPYQYCLTECYNGITWSNLSNTNYTGRAWGRATGTTTSALLNGGSRFNSNTNPATCTEVWDGNTWSAGVDTPYGGELMSSFGNNSNSINLLGGNCGTTVYNCNIEWNGTSWNASTSLPKSLRGMGAAGIPSAGVVFQGLEYYPLGYNTNYIHWNGVSWNTGVSRPQSTFGGAAYGGTETSAWSFGTNGNAFCTAVYDGTSYYEDNSYYGLSDWCYGSGTGPSGTNGLGISGRQGNGLSKTFEYTSGESSAVHFDNSTSQLVFTAVSSSGHYADDAAAAAGGVPLGGIYRNGNFIAIRLT
jgi:hypothetical protein